MIVLLNLYQKCSADADGIWRLVKQVESIPRYWHGTKELKVVMKGIEYEGTAKFAFGGQSRVKIRLEETTRRVIVEYLDGAFTGLQSISVEKGGVSVTWDIHFRGIYRIFGKTNARHFANGSSNALARICEEAIKSGNT